MKKIVLLMTVFLLVNSSLIYADSEDSTYTNIHFFPINLGDYESLIDVKTINSQDTYDSLTTMLREEHSWLKEAPPKIDFENFTLVGDESWADCVASFSYKVERDTISRGIIITIIEHYGGGRGMNKFEHWFLVPKIPADHSIEIIHKEGEPKYHYDD